MINHVVLVSGVQQSDSVIHIEAYKREYQVGDGERKSELLNSADKS